MLRCVVTLIVVLPPANQHPQPRELRVMGKRGEHEKEGQERECKVPEERVFRLKRATLAFASTKFCWLRRQPSPS